MGEAQRRKLLGTSNTHDMKHLEAVDALFAAFAKRVVMVHEGTTHNRDYRRAKDQERAARRRRRKRADLRDERADDQTQLELARANILGAEAWKANAAAVRLYRREHAALVATGMTRSRATAEMARLSESEAA